MKMTLQTLITMNKTEIQEMIARLEMVEQLFCDAEINGHRFTHLEQCSINAIQDVLDYLEDTCTGTTICIMN